MREIILAFLRARPEEFVSGAEISKRLGVSRTAVWKQIEGLRAEGYKIEAYPRRGYALRQSPDLLSPAEIALGLGTKNLGKKVSYFPAVESTNQVARELAEKGAEEGTLVVAEAQTKGQGRLNRNWVSPSGKGIWTSLVLRPPSLPAEATYITLLAAIAVAKAIRQVAALPAGIKWPNDVLVNEKKVCGILAETEAELDQVHYVVLGIGINVNLDQEDFPPELMQTATSLKIEKGETVSRLQLLQALLKELEGLYLTFLFERGGVEEIRKQWKKLNVTLGREVKVSFLNQSYQGKAVDLDPEGALLVREPDGKLHRFHAGDVTLK